jgi:hypothetical protein
MGSIEAASRPGRVFARKLKIGVETVGAARVPKFTLRPRSRALIR